LLEGFVGSALCQLLCQHFPSDCSNADQISYAKQVVVLAMPGSPGADAADERGLAALAILRAMGLPTLVGLVQEPNNSLKEKSAAKKRGRALLDREVRV